MLRRTILAACVLAVSCVNMSAIAQVALGPGSVDAPYVHVDWNHGRVHVVAPFVNLCIRAPAGCQPETIPLPPPVQTSLRPSATNQIVATGYRQLVERDQQALPTWSASGLNSSSGREPAAEKALAHDIARPN
jgi:hypothetical protein